MSLAGEILYYRDYEFEDGSRGNKFFVVLNAADVASPCLLLKTTSQSKRYEGAGKGCNPQKRVFSIPANWQNCFVLNTYVQLPQIIPISVEDLLNGAFSSKMTIKGSHSGECFNLLKNCLKQFKQDISPWHWNLIFSAPNIYCGDQRL